VKFYIPQLDGLRFFAFLLVFFHHLRPADGYFENIPVLAEMFSFLHDFGWIGVDLFLVLSAFLITKLLLLEYATEKHISLPKFYIRRILRIWPLYFFMLLLIFIVLPSMGEYYVPGIHSIEYQNLTNKYLFPHLFFLGNFSAGYYGMPNVSIIAHLWTVGIEEQFYIFWPFLLLFLLKNKTRYTYFMLFLLLLLSMYMRYYFVSNSVHPMIWTNTVTRLDPLILGIFLAFSRDNDCISSRGSVVKVLFGLVCVAGITLSSSIHNQSIHVVWQYFILALGFYLIVDACVSDNEGVINTFLSNKIFVWLGKLTYGLYVYHLLGIKCADRVMTLFEFYDTFNVWLLHFSISLMITIIMAIFSYYFFERFFLKFKGNFTSVASRPV